VSEVQGLADLLRSDPILTYGILAALFLLIVSLGSGLAHLDIVSLGKPQVLIHIAVAVSLAFLLRLLSDRLGTLPLQLSSPYSFPFSLTDLSRFPLYLTALAYGPSAGLFSAGLVAAYHTDTPFPGWNEAILGLELALVGWLSIFPSPRQARWAGPLNVLLAYILAWSTAGLALLQFASGNVTVLSLWQQHQQVLGGVMISALLLYLLGPRWYRRRFPHSRLPTPPVAKSKKGRPLDSGVPKALGSPNALDGDPGAEPAQKESPPVTNRALEADDLI
jgi:thiamine transporter ThiT